LKEGSVIKMSNETSSDKDNMQIQASIRSPRSAAIAGILFSILMIVSMSLISAATPPNPADIDPDLFDTDTNIEWLDAWISSVTPVLGIVSLAGVAFLWFTGVIRDRMGRMEDRFFATIFYGSGLLFLAMIFVWVAVAGALIGSYSAVAVTIIDKDIYIFGLKFMDAIDNYALRMAGVYMLSIGTLWTRTGAMPRWLTIITYVVALGFLIFAGAVQSIRLVFPIWVFLVSVYILITNRAVGRSAAAMAK
jgi:hypothetical protein